MTPGEEILFAFLSFALDKPQLRPRNLTYPMKIGIPKRKVGFQLLPPPG